MQTYVKGRSAVLGWDRKQKIAAEERRLEDLISVGPAIRRQLALLGVYTVAQLARRNPEALYRRLCRKTKMRQDICVLDVYRAAVAQAQNPDLPSEHCVWWYWSRVRKNSGTVPDRPSKSTK